MPIYGPPTVEGNWQDLVMVAVYPITIPAASSSSLATLCGVTFPATARRLVITRAEAASGKAIFFTLGGTASAASGEWPSSGESAGFTPAVMNAIKVFCTDGCAATVQQFDERA
jgi:hypothetical protein